MATPDDPVRAEVERWVRTFITAAVAVPGAAIERVGRCVSGRMGTVTERVAEPVRLVKSLVELATGASASHGGTVAVAPAASTEAADDGPSAASPDADELPIEEYESLAASHVIARLENLSPTELRKVREFEAAHRGRRTVLGRIDQLLGAATSA
jgi:hypothetical protein